MVINSDCILFLRVALIFSSTLFHTPSSVPERTHPLRCTYTVEEIILRGVYGISGHRGEEGVHHFFSPKIAVCNFKLKVFSATGLVNGCIPETPCFRFSICLFFIKHWLPPPYLPFLRKIR